MRETIVIKCGGSILSELSDSFFTSIRDLKEKGYQIVIVHGGGPEIASMLSSLQISSEFVNGLRKTTKEVLEVVEMVLSGKVNKSLVADLTKAGLPALGLAGSDANLLSAAPININQLGYVGEVVGVNTELISHLLEMDYVPVISPIGIDNNCNKYNINADTAAASVAIHLQAKHLLFVTNVPGVLKDDQVLPVLTADSIKELINEGTIYGGMIPKVDAAISVLNNSQLKEITIINGKDSLLSIDGQLKGTKIMKELEVV